MNHETPLNVNDPDHVDPVLEEIWQIRRELSARFNGDMEAMGRYFQKQGEMHTEHASSRRPQPGGERDGA